MTVQDQSPQRKGLLLKLAVLAVFGLAGAWVLLRGVNLRELLEHILAWIRSVGPAAFFTALAILPAFGFPVLAFTLSAGPVFSPQLGLGWVIALTLLSMTVNMAFTYWLARYAFRPFLEGLIKRLGYSLPQVAAEDHVSLAVLVRITPGPPFFVQGYLLGLANVPFKIYMAASLPIAGSFAVSVIVFGDSIMHGRAKVAFFAVSMLIALSVIVQMVRRRMARRKLQSA